MHKKITKILKAEEEAEKIILAGTKEAEKILDHARKEAIAKTEAMEKLLVEKRAAELKELAEETQQLKKHILAKANDDTANLEKRHALNKAKAVQHITRSLLMEEETP
jgi:vacuolar-type H+-ATPase subunit H